MGRDVLIRCGVRVVMQIVGAMMILGGCVGIGFWYRNLFLERNKSLRTLARILEMLMSEIRYGKSTMPESCKAMAGRLEEPYSSGLKGVCVTYQNSEQTCFQEVFCREMEAVLRQLPLKREDLEIFFQPFREQGFQDGSMQLKCFEQGLVRMKETIRVQEEELREKCRMAVGLGVMSGLLLLIVLL